MKGKANLMAVLRELTYGMEVNDGFECTY